MCRFIIRVINDTRRQKIIEEPEFGTAIALEIAVVVQVVSGQIAEHTGVDREAIQAALL